MKRLTLVGGVMVILLGGLWLLQGLGFVYLQPVLCFTECTPLQSPSATWIVIGALALAIGASVVIWAFQRHPD